jgi:hypothetical protein
MGGFLAGSIVGKLLLDKSGWDAKIKEASQDAGGLAGNILTHSKTIAGIGTAMTVVGGAITGVLMTMIKSTAAAGEEIYNLSVKTGVSTELLSGYKLAAEQSETSLQGLAMGFKFLGRNMDGACEGTKRTGGAFKTLGVDVKDSELNLRPMNDVMLDLADKFSVMEDGPKKSALAMKIFGRAGADLIPFLNLGRQGLQDNWKEAEKLGMIYTEEAAKGADDFGDSLKALKAGMGSLGKEVSTQVMPTLTGIIQKATGVVKVISQWVTSHGELVKILALSVGGVGAFLVAAGPILFMLPNIVLGLKLVSGALPAILSKLGPIATAGAAAFAGWQLGRLMGELFGTDKLVEDISTKVINLLGIGKGITPEWGEAHIKAAEKTQLAITTAFEVSGKKVATYKEAVGLLEPIYLKTGTTGNLVVDGLIKAHVAADKAAKDHAKSLKEATAAATGWEDFLKSKSIPTTEEQKARILELNGVMIGLGTQLAAGGISYANYQLAMKAARDEMDTLTGVSKAWSDFLKAEGIPTVAENKAEIANLKDVLKGLWEAYADGKISLVDYNKASDDAKLKLGLLDGTITPLKQNQRDLNGVLEKAPDHLEDTAYYTDDLDGVMQKLSDDTGYSIATFKLLAYESARLALSFQGIILPDLTFDPKQKGAMDRDRKDFSDSWAGSLNQLSQQFGSTFSSFVSTWSWDKIVNGQINFKPFFADLWKNIKDTFFQLVGELATKWLKTFVEDALMKGTAKGAASAASSVISGVGDVVGVGAKAVTGVATGVINTVANVVTAVASVLDLLKGPQKQTDVTYWLKMIKDLDQEMHDMFRDLIAIMVYEQAQGDEKWNFQVEQINVAKETNSLLNDIWGETAKVVAALATVPKAATGMVFQSPTLAWVAEKKAEAVLPLDQLAEIASRPAGGTAGGGSAGGGSQPGAGGPSSVLVNIKPILINKGDKWMIKFIQESIDHGELTFPIAGVVGR